MKKRSKIKDRQNSSDFQRFACGIVIVFPIGFVKYVSDQHKSFFEKLLNFNNSNGQFMVGCAFCI